MGCLMLQGIITNSVTLCFLTFPFYSTDATSLPTTSIPTSPQPTRSYCPGPTGTGSAGTTLSSALVMEMSSVRIWSWLTMILGHCRWRHSMWERIRETWPSGSYRASTGLWVTFTWHFHFKTSPAAANSVASRRKSIHSTILYYFACKIEFGITCKASPLQGTVDSKRKKGN